MDGCVFFEHCSAPLCPLDKVSMKKGVWYSEEAICRKRAVPIWARKQKELRKHPPRNGAGFSVSGLLQAKIDRKHPKSIPKARKPAQGGRRTDGNKLT